MKYIFKLSGMMSVAMMIFMGLIASVAQAGSLLDEMQVQDTCGTTYADKLLSCTPFRCQKPGLMAILIPSDEALKEMSPKQRQQLEKQKVSTEERLKKMSPEKRAELKARMTSLFEIKGFNAQGQCRTETGMSPKYVMRCAYDAPMLKRVSDYARIIAKADHVESDSSGSTINGKWVTKSVTKVDGKIVDNPLVEAMNKKICKTLKKDADRGRIDIDQMNRMAHIELNLSEHGKHVAGHVKILNTADGKVLFDKDVAADRQMREINLKPGTFDIKVVSKNSQLSLVWFRGVKLGQANIFRKSIEFYAITGTLNLTSATKGNPSKIAIYITDPDTHKWIYHSFGVNEHEPKFEFLPTSIKLPETLTGKYEVHVTPVIQGFKPPKGAKYEKFLITIKNGETVEKAVNFDSITGKPKAAGKQALNLVPLRLYWSGKNQDNFVTATRKGVKEALAAGYRFSRIEACIIGADTKLSERSPGSAALKLFWSSNRGDHFSTASSGGAQDAMAAGYQFVRTEGYILPVKQPGTVPLKLYWSSGRKDNFSTASQQGVHAAEGAGYRYARIQGYVYPPSKCQSKSSPLAENKVDVVAGKLNKPSISSNAGHSAKPSAPAMPASATPRQATGKNANTLFILDASGSMWGQIKGKPKITIAKEVMAKLVPELPDNARIGLIAYGHRRKGDCNDVETLVKLAANDKQTVLKAVKGLNAKGKTPLTRSVNQAIDMLRSEENSSTVILVSDGIESCGGDPCAAVKAAKASGVNFILHTVGFGLSKKESAQLQCMAKAGGGEYFQANNAEELLKSARKAVQPTGVLKLTVKLNGKVNDLMYRVEDASTGKMIRQPVLPTASGMAIRLPDGQYNVFISPAGVSGAGEQKLSLRMKAGEVIKKTLSFGKGVLHLTVMVNGKPAHAHIHVEESSTHKGIYESSVFGYDTPLDINLAEGKVDIVAQVGGRDLQERRAVDVNIVAGKTTEQIISFEAALTVPEYVTHLGAGTWIGWDSSEGPMGLLDADEGKFFGFYNQEDHGRLLLQRNESDVTGYWVENNSRQQCASERDGSRYWGRIKWKFDDKFSSFSGSWSYCDADPSGSKWTGKRSAIKSVTTQANGMEQDTDRPGGGDFRHVLPTDDDPALCQQACQDEPQCKAWTYVKPNTIQGSQPNCWLKGSVPPANHNSCCISGLRQ